VILPAGNAADLEDVPEEIRESMTLHTVHSVKEAVEIALAA